MRDAQGLGIHGRASGLLQVGLVATVLAAALILASPATATVTIGEDTATPGDIVPANCESDTLGCTYVQDQHISRSFAAPVDGVIVRWRIRGDSQGTQFSLRVLHHNGDGTWTGAGTGEPVPVLPGIENVFETRLPIEQGEYIGVNVAPGLDTTGGVDSRVVSSTPVTENHSWRPALADQETRAPGGPRTDNESLLYNADIEPDCDNDGLGDETQDPELFGGSCPARGRSLTLDANKDKVKKGKRVTLSGQLTELLRQGECQFGQPVELQRKKPTQTAFTTVGQIQTDAAGSFSTKEKVKKTFEYRALVSETATCAGQTSNTETVKVKKRR